MDRSGGDRNDRLDDQRDERGQVRREGREQKNGETETGKGPASHSHDFSSMRLEHRLTRDFLFR